MNKETISIRPALLAEVVAALASNMTDEKILDFAGVEEGWHFGEGGAIKATAIRDAMKLHNTLLEWGFYETDAFPGFDGEVRVTAYTENEYFEFTREADESWSYLLERHGEVEDQQDSLTLDEVQDIIKQHVGRTWNTYAFCHGNIGTLAVKDFKLLPSDRQKTEEFQSSRWNASPLICGQSAVTSENFTLPQGNRQSFGGSMIPYYQTPSVSTKLPAIPTTSAIETWWESLGENPNEYFANTAAFPVLKSATETNQNSLVWRSFDMGISRGLVLQHWVGGIMARSQFPARNKKARH